MPMPMPTKLWDMLPPGLRPRVPSGRSGIIATVADIVLANEAIPAVDAALDARYTGDDLIQADVFASALLFMRDEMGRDAVKRVRDKHRALAA